MDKGRYLKSLSWYYIKVLRVPKMAPHPPAKKGIPDTSTSPPNVEVESSQGQQVSRFCWRPELSVTSSHEQANFEPGLANVSRGRGDEKSATGFSGTGLSLIMFTAYARLHRSCPLYRGTVHLSKHQTLHVGV